MSHIAYASELDKGDITYDMPRVIDRFAAISGKEEKIGEVIQEETIDEELF